VEELFALHEQRCQTFALFERLLKSRLQDAISDAAYVGKAADIAATFSAISVAVRELQARPHSALVGIIDRMQAYEQQHWACVLELHAVELALSKVKALEEAAEAEAETTAAVTCDHAHHAHAEQEHTTAPQSPVDTNDEVHVLERQKSTLISRRDQLRELIQDIVDDARE
jgi:hypothetical protein